MSDTMWFEREPGSPVAKGTTDPTTLLLSEDAPDWVGLPDELGGGRVKVEKAVVGPCPSCKSKHAVRHLVLGAPFGVAECGMAGFLWYAQKEEKVRCDGPCGLMVDADTVVVDATDRNERDGIVLCAACAGEEDE